MSLLSLLAFLPAAPPPLIQSDPLDIKEQAPVVQKEGKLPSSNAHLTFNERAQIDAANSDPWHRLGGEGAEAGDKEPRAPKGLLSSVGHSSREHFQLDVGPDGTLWAFGGTYKASFDESGATYIPALGSDAPRNFPVTFGSPEIMVDGERVEIDGFAEPVFDGNTAVFQRGAVTEKYELQVGQMEQLFVLQDGTRRGAIHVAIPFQSELAATYGEGALLFEGPHGGVSYTHAVAIDADGVRVAVETTFDGNSIQLAVPADFVAAAAFPLTIDPIVTTFTIGPDANIDLTWPDIAYDASELRWIIVWQREFSATDDDIWSEYYTPTGDPIAGTGVYVDFTTSQWRLPKVANNAGADQFLVVAQVEGSPVTIWGRTREADSNTMGSQIQISSDTRDCRAPDVGGNTTSFFGQNYCVVWERYFTLAVDHDVHAKLVTTASGVGNLILVDNSSATYDKVPSISPSNGAGQGGFLGWNISFQREFSSTDWDIRGAGISLLGNSTSSFSIDFSSRDHRWPDSSTSLDGIGVAGAREWMCVYEAREPDGIEDIMATSLRGEDVLQSRNVSDLFVSGAGQDQVQPCVDTNGHSFAVGWSQRFAASVTDWDIFAGTLYHAGGAIHVSESPVALATSLDFELNVEVSSRRSAGVESNWAGFVWRDWDLDGTGDSDIEGTIFLLEGNYGNEIGVNYCSPIANSTGSTALIHASGSRFAGSNPLALSAYRMPVGVNGYFIGSPNAGNALPGSSSGRVCVGNPLSRFNSLGQILNSGTDGRFTLQVNTGAIPLPSGGTTALVAGQTFRFQAWFRDGFTNNLSDGVAVTFL